MAKFKFQTFIIVLLLLTCAITLLSCTDSSRNPSHDASTEATTSEQITELFTDDVIDETPTSENTEAVEIKQVPVFQGITITTKETESLVLYARSSLGRISATNAPNNSSVKTMSLGADRGKDEHDNRYHGNHIGEKEFFDKNNPFPGHDGNIEDAIKSSLEIVGSSQLIYFAQQGEDIYFNIHISNPDDFEIISFTLNGEKYSSYMFEKGSDMENIIIKYNTSAEHGIVDYTIDAIKYVDGTEIKDVIIDGEQTVKAGIKTEDQVKADVSNLSIGANNISFELNVTDPDELIAHSNGKLKAVLYNGENLVETKDVSLGKNTLTFESLSTYTPYQLAIVGLYDDFSGNGFGVNILYKDAFYTDSIVLFDQIVVTKDSISFKLDWNASITHQKLVSMKLFKDQEFCAEVPVDSLQITDLLSDSSYSLVAEYQNNSQTEQIYINFTTFAKVVPQISLSAGSATSDKLSFDIVETDEDFVGALTKIELIHEAGIIEAEDTNIRFFDHLLSDNSYTIRITYTYDLNDGNGEKVIVEEIVMNTSSKIVPDNFITKVHATQESVTFTVSETDPDGIGAVEKIELLLDEQIVYQGDGNVREINDLLSNREYVLRVTYTYDLNDGAGKKNIVQEIKIRTEAKTVPTVAVLEQKTTTSSTGFTIDVVDNDQVGFISKIELIHKDGTIVADNTEVREFEKLLSNHEYTVRVTYTYDLNDGIGTSTVTAETVVTTMAKRTPSVEIQNVAVDGNTVSFDISSTDVDDTIIRSEASLLLGDDLQATKDFIASGSFGELFYGSTYTLKITVYYDLNDGTGEKETSITKKITTEYYRDEQGVSYRTNSDGTASVVKFSGSATDIVIPNEVLGYTVTSIADQVFKHTAITSVFIPESVTSIGTSAFESCYKLKTVVLNDGLKSIGENAFLYTYLNHMVIPSSVEIIGRNAFYFTELFNPYAGPYAGAKLYCEAESKPDGWAINFVTSEPNNPYFGSIQEHKACFWGFDRFVENDGVQYAISTLGKAEIVMALENKSSYTLLSEIQDCTVVGIGPNAFAHDLFINMNGYSICDIRSLTLPDKLEYINYNAFYMAELPALLFPETLEYVDREAFSDVCFAGTVEFTSSWIYIDEYAFSRITFNSALIIDGEYIYNYDNSSNLLLPLHASGYIKKFAFSGAALRFINIPYNMEIGDNAFYGCDNLKICCITDRRPTSWGDEWEDGAPVKWNSYVDTQGVVYTINENIQYNGQATFTITDYWNQGINSLFVPEKVLGRVVCMVGEEAFWDTDVYYGVYLPATIEVIAERAFDSDMGYWIAEEHNYIQNGLFLHRDAIQTTVEKCVYTSALSYELYSKYWDDNGIYYEIYMMPSHVGNQEVIIPEGVNRIYPFAFSGCNGVSRVTIPNSVTRIDWSAFEGCSSLTSIIFDGTVAQWNAITKDSVWNNATPATEVICSDGTVSLV